MSKSREENKGHDCTERLTKVIAEMVKNNRIAFEIKKIALTELADKDFKHSYTYAKRLIKTYKVPI